MADNISVKKYLDLLGLTFYDHQLKSYYASNETDGVVGYSDTTGKLARPRRIGFSGSVSGSGVFDGSDNIVINTTLNLPEELSVNITGSAATASAFTSGKTINITGDVIGYGTGGTTSAGWTVPVTLADAAVSNVKLAGGITNDKLVNSSITLGSTTVALGGTEIALTGLNSVTASTFIGSLQGTATAADQDTLGNVIPLTYATKAEVANIQAAFNFCGVVPTAQDLPLTAATGDIYLVTDNDQTVIWAYDPLTDTYDWEFFGSAYGPATSSTFGLVKIGSNITNAAGVISILKSNIDVALGYPALQGVKVNGLALAVTDDRYVDIPLPTDYMTEQAVMAKFTAQNIANGLGYFPIGTVSVNNTDLVPTNNRVNIDLSSYATQAWTQDQINTVTGSVYTFKGSLANYGALLDIQNPKIGDTYNIITGNDPDVDNPTWPSFTGGTNFSWEGDVWDGLGGAVNLASYYKKSEVDAIAAGKSSIGHTHNSLYYTKAEVDSLLADMRTWVRQQIAAAQTDAEDTGETNDVRTYTTYSSFPPVGVEGVIYVDSTTGTPYIWLDNGIDPARYIELNQTATVADIGNIFD